MHRNNKHIASYNFNALIKRHPKLETFVFIHPLTNKKTIDFFDNEAVFHLNKAILLSDYGLKDYNIPKGYLCPPIPSRADYIHEINDLIATNTSKTIHGLDIGVGANTIYPILGAQLYNWHMVGCDINFEAVQSAKQNVNLTPELASKIEIRHQKNPAYLFKEIINADEYYDFTMCNPPFFTSEADAAKNSKTKFKNLKQSGPVSLNFGGQAHELWCNGGEALFIKRMIKQSVNFKDQVGWFTTLVSKQEHLIKLKAQLKKTKVDYRVISMTQGHKKSRILAWKFPDKPQTTSK